MEQNEPTFNSKDRVDYWARAFESNSAPSFFLKAALKKKFGAAVTNANLDEYEQREVRVEKTPITQPSLSVTNLEEDKAHQFRAGLEACLDADSFEPGLKSATEHYIEKWLKDDVILVQINIGKIFLECTHNEKRLVGILNAIAHLERETFHPVNELITLASLSNISVEVQECAIRVYEYWEDPNLIGRLKHHKLTPKWLDDYRKQVILDFCGAK